MRSLPVTRRGFLRAAGVAVSLPLFESLPARGAGSAGSAAGAPPRRMVCVCAPLGLYAGHLFPRKAGTDYESTPYLELLKEFRSDMTVFSGVSHPAVVGGHKTVVSFLTCAPYPYSPTFKNSISLDQYAVEKLRPDTRLPFLPIAVSPGLGGSTLSFTRSGAPIPPEQSPSALFARMFLAGKPAEIERQVSRLKDGQSVLDAVLGDAGRVRKALPRRDADKLDAYFTSVREVELGLAKAQEWARRPKPKVDMPPPKDVASKVNITDRTRLMYDLTHLALQTDTTRFVTINLPAFEPVPEGLDEVRAGFHQLSHHGKDPDRLEQLTKIETAELRLLRDFVARLKASKEAGGALLDRTTVLFGSNLGDANNHRSDNMPFLLFGGGFRHGRHLAFDNARNEAAPKIFVSMLQRLGVETDAFAGTRGTLPGLETTGA